MANKSILDIDLDDSSFRNFHALFQKYNAQVEAMPGAWKKVGIATKTAGNDFAHMTATLLAQNEMLTRQVHSMERFRRETEGSHRAMEGLARSTLRVARNIAHTTTSILRWTGATALLGGLLGAGGLFGLDRLAGAAFGLQRRAGGLGISTAQNQAFRINYGRYFDTDSLLHNVADAKQDYSRRWAFSAMGISQADVNRLNPAQLGAEMAVHAKRIFESGGMSRQYAESRGLLQFYSMEDLRRLHNTSYKDLEASRSRYGADTRAFALNNNTLDKWTRLNIQLERAGTTIENVFIKDLGALAPGISKLSDSFAKAVDTFMSSDQLKKWIAELGVGIEKFANYITTPQFEQGVKSFGENVIKLAEVLGRAVAWIYGHGGKFIADEVPATPSAAQQQNFQNQADMGAWKAWWKRGIFEKFTQPNRPSAPSPELLDSLRHVESHDGKYLISPKGALGPYQLMPGTAQGLGVSDPMNEKQARAGARRYLIELLGKYHNDMDKALAAYNWGPGNLDKEIAKYGDKWRENLPRSVSNYIGLVRGGAGFRNDVVPLNPQQSVDIRVWNQTGGNANVSSSQLPQ